MKCNSRDWRGVWDTCVNETVREVNVDKQDAENHNFHVKIAFFFFLFRFKIAFLFKKRKREKKNGKENKITMITVG